MWRTRTRPAARSRARRPARAAPAPGPMRPARPPPTPDHPSQPRPPASGVRGCGVFAYPPTQRREHTSMSDETTTPALTSGPAAADEEAARLAGKLSGNETLSDVAGKITQLPTGVKLSSNLDTYEKEKPAEEFWFQHE